MVIFIKMLKTSFEDFSIYRQSSASSATYCQLLLQNVQDLMSNAYPKMINLERDQKHFKTYMSFLFGASQEFSGIYYSLNNKKLKFDCCLNHQTKPIITGENYNPH